jgi:hypothetical protein
VHRHTKLKPGVWSLDIREGRSLWSAAPCRRFSRARSAPREAGNPSVETGLSKRNTVHRCHSLKAGVSASEKLGGGRRGGPALYSGRGPPLQVFGNSWVLRGGALAFVRLAQILLDCSLSAVVVVAVVARFVVFRHGAVAIAVRVVGIASVDVGPDL